MATLFMKIIEKIYLSSKDNLVYYDGLTKVRNRIYCDKVVKPKYNNIECMVIFMD